MMETHIKYNDTTNSDTLICEAKGLGLLQASIEEYSNRYIKTPSIYKVSKDELHLQKIKTKPNTKEQSLNLGVGLAILHKKSNSTYGLEYDNYIGLSKQKNILTTNWGDFFIDYRLLYQVNKINDEKLRDKFLSKIEKARVNLSEFLNSSCENPSLVHGDLWSGNVLYDEKQVYIIDPAVYYADREVDIAMTKMFGGFDSVFYEYYNKTYPLSKEYLKKEPIYNLYHYLNHYNLFGSMYLGESVQKFRSIKEFYE